MAALEEIALASVGISLASALLYRFLTKPQETKNLKQDMKSLREQMRKAQKEGKMEEANKYMAETMKLSHKQLSMNAKPLLISGFLFIVVTTFLRATYPTFQLALPFPLPLLSYSFPFIVIRETIGWLWWYILVAIPAALLFRRFMGVE